jgi:hypothetical protein
MSSHPNRPALAQLQISAFATDAANLRLAPHRRGFSPLLFLPHCESDGLELAGERELTRADVVPMQRVQRVRHSGASVGHRSEHLADITWDAHVRATAGAECRKRIP